MDEAARQRGFEQQFLQQLRARAQALTASGRPADRVEIAGVPDGRDTVVDQLRRLEIYDRDALQQTPGRDALQLTFKRSRLGGLYHEPVSRLRAQTLIDARLLHRDGTREPIGREQVLDTLARYTLMPSKKRPTAVVLASPTGFTAEAKALVENAAPPTMILMGGRADGGWDVSAPQRVLSGPWATLFEFESQDERLERLKRHLSETGMELDSRGVAVATLAERLGVSAKEAETLVRKACRQDPRLMTVVHDGTMRVCRSPLADEGDPMSFWTRIKRMFGAKPTAAETVRGLTAQRVRLEQERHDVDQQVDALETQERDLLQRGAAATSDAEKKQLANKLLRVRGELKRQRTRAQVFSQQIDVIGAQIHHTTLTEQTKQVSLPSSEELAQQAAQAEASLSDLAASAEIANSFEVGAETPMQSEAQDEIFAEFEQVRERTAAGSQSGSTAAERSRAESAPAADSAESAPEHASAPPPLPADRSKARPETG